MSIDQSNAAGPIIKPESFHDYTLRSESDITVTDANNQIGQSLTEPTQTGDLVADSSLFTSQDTPASNLDAVAQPVSANVVPRRRWSRRQRIGAAVTGTALSIATAVGVGADIGSHSNAPTRAEKIAKDYSAGNLIAFAQDVADATVAQDGKDLYQYMSKDMKALVKNNPSQFTLLVDRYGADFNGSPKLIDGNLLTATRLRSIGSVTALFTGMKNSDGQSTIQVELQKENGELKIGDLESKIVSN